MLLKTDLHFLSYQQFKQLFYNDKIMSQVAWELQDIHGFQAFNRIDLEETLIKSDKDLFVAFRDKKITYD